MKGAFMKCAKGLRSWAGLVMLMGVFSPLRSEGACSVVEGDKDHNGTTDLRIVGDTRKQIVVVEIRNGSYLVKIDCNANGSFTDAVDVVKSGSAAIETYSLELGGGDVITLRQTEDLAGAVKNVSLALGPGADNVTYATDGHDLLAGSSLEIEATGVGSGAATLTVDLTGSVIDKSTLFLRTDLGAGADRLKLLGPATVTSSLVDLGVRLGAGNNVLGTSDGGGALSASTLYERITSDNGPAEAANITSSFAGRIDKGSRVFYSLNLGSGGNGQTASDRWTGQFDLGRFAIDPAVTIGTSEAYFNIKGFGGFDILQVDDGGTNGPATVNGLLSFLLDGGGQPDTLGMNWSGLTGTGKFRYWADGATSIDQLRVDLVATATSRNDIDLYVGGGPENDLGSPHGDGIEVSVQNYGHATFGPARAVVLDGGLEGPDPCSYQGNAPRVVINCESGSW
jgi:hypothetical protein